MLAKVVLLSCLASQALCSNVFSSIESCLTQVGTVSVKNVPTAHSTKTVQQSDATVQVTNSPTLEVTPAAVNHTRTVTTTVFSQPSSKGAVVTSTITFVSYTTTRSALTNIVSVTSTQLSTYTTTIPTPSGFLPVADTTASVYPGVVQHSNSTITASSSSIKSSTSSTAKTTAARKGRAMNAIQQRSKPQNFPKAVNCIKSILLQNTKTHTVTGKRVTKTLQPQTQTLTTTTTVTSTLPARTVRGQTIFVTHTVTSTATLRPTASSTTTVTIKATTTQKIYAACATNNLLGPLLSNGATITQVGSGSSNHAITAAASAAECCAKCVEYAGCSASSFLAVRGAQGVCSLYHSGAETCSAQSGTALAYSSHKGTGNAAGLVVSNGLCGYLYQG